MTNLSPLAAMDFHVFGHFAKAQDLPILIVCLARLGAAGQAR
jgi:hypothetical protein